MTLLNFICVIRVVIRISVSQFKMQTQTLRLTKTKELTFTAVFIALSVYAPILVHYFGGVNAGRSFLPMHFFVLIAGLLLGWRAGLVAGLATPLISYFISGMPTASMLPFIILEVASYGLIAGLLKETVKLNVWASLVGALIVGRILIGISVFIFSDEDAVKYALTAAQNGISGIGLQLLLVPLVVKNLYKYFGSSSLFQREARRD
jgi:riboflavin transporter FmnP